MKPDFTRVKLVAALMLLAALPSFAAGKRRAVNHPSPGTPFTATIKGTVLDSVTGTPVARASISFANRQIIAATDGTFELKDVAGFGTDVPVVASRTGYDSETQRVSGSGTFTLTFHLRPHATITLRRTDGSSVVLDDDSIQLGYVPPFSSYVTSTSQSFCKPDGAKSTIDVSEIKRIVGPAVLVPSTSCCSREGASVQRVRLELRNGQSGDYIITDSCTGYLYDVIGRDHTTWAPVYVKLSDTAEVIFP